MRRIAILAVLVGGLLVSGCAGGDGDDSDDVRAGSETPEAVRVQVWERSFSECASYDVRRLAAKYRVDPERRTVAVAVGENWAEFFNGGADAVASGRDGCLQGLGSQ